MSVQLIFRGHDTSFTDLVSDEEQLARVTMGFHDVIAMSLALDACTVTDAEVKRRFELCTKVFRILRGDMKWGVSRILDYLPEYLGAELAGNTWEPDKRQCWVPSDGH